MTISDLKIIPSSSQYNKEQIFRKFQSDQLSGSATNLYINLSGNYFQNLVASTPSTTFIYMFYIPFKFKEISFDRFSIYTPIARVTNNQCIFQIAIYRADANYFLGTMTREFLSNNLTITNNSIGWKTTIFSTIPTISDILNGLWICIKFVSFQSNFRLARYQFNTTNDDFFISKQLSTTTNNNNPSNFILNSNPTDITLPVSINNLDLNTNINNMITSNNMILSSIGINNVKIYN